MEGSVGRRGLVAGALALLAGCAATSGAALSPVDRADVARVQSALDALRGFRARFVQTAPDRSSSVGTVWYDPGRLRLDYAAPQRMVVVASGRHLVAHRASDDSTTRIALSGNPLGLLLHQPLRLSGAIEVTDIQRRPGVLQISLARAANPSQGLLTLIFADQTETLRLVGLEAVDARGARTRFHLFDTQSGLGFPQGLFTPPAG